MPVYEFRCKKCKTEFERLCRLSEPMPACPTCGSEVEKCFSRFGFSSGGKTVTSTGSGSCASCHSGNCNTCGG
jgi:putative FmdB family regulatory protein